jgi:hypothetical protein
MRTVGWFSSLWYPYKQRFNTIIGNFLQEKAAEATKQKEEKREKHKP